MSQIQLVDTSQLFSKAANNNIDIISVSSLTQHTFTMTVATRTTVGDLGLSVKVKSVQGTESAQFASLTKLPYDNTIPVLGPPVVLYPADDVNTITALGGGMTSYGGVGNAGFDNTLASIIFDEILNIDGIKTTLIGNSLSDALVDELIPNVSAIIMVTAFQPSQGGGDNIDTTSNTNTNIQIQGMFARNGRTVSSVTNAGVNFLLVKVVSDSPTLNAVASKQVRSGFSAAEGITTTNTVAYTPTATCVFSQKVTLKSYTSTITGVTATLGTNGVVNNHTISIFANTNPSTIPHGTSGTIDLVVENQAGVRATVSRPFTVKGFRNKVFTLTAPNYALSAIPEIVNQADIRVSATGFANLLSKTSGIEIPNYCQDKRYDTLALANTAAGGPGISSAWTAENKIFTFTAQGMSNYNYLTGNQITVNIEEI